MKKKPFIIWSKPLKQLRLGNNEVHFWRAFLNQSAENVVAFYRILSSDEIERAGKFRFQKDHNRFVVARGILRTILGRYLKINPSEIVFKYNKYGKPFLSASPDNDVIHFNTSHSNEIALYAFTLAGKIGIDVEYINRNLVFEDIAEKFFSKDEAAKLREIPEEKKAEEFFNYWTCQEAYIKAKGQGLSLPLENFSVSFASNKSVVLLTVADDPAESDRWVIKKLCPMPEYAAAIAIEKRKWRSVYWQFDR